MPEPIKAGIIGCDTSHVIAFTETLNNEKAKDHVPGVRIVAAYPSFSEDIESSKGRVEEYTDKLRKQYRVRITDSIGELVKMVDAVLIESVDGRRHLKELQAVVKAAGHGKLPPVYIDKPFAASLADAKEMVRIIKKDKLPCFSSSSLRYLPVIQAFLRDTSHGKVMGCDAFSPASLEPTNPGFYWYGIHGVEILYAIMGPGCKDVRCTSTRDVDVAVGIWGDGRVGTMQGRRKPPHDYGAMAYAEKRVVCLVEPHTYIPLVREIAEFFKTRKPPVPIDETLEIMAFIDAALESSKAEGKEVPLGL
jgi:predicted dehydrogenase